MLTTSSGTAVQESTLRAPLQHAQYEEGETCDWGRAHDALSRLARERAAMDAEEGRWLLAALRAATHVHLGLGSFAEYVERLFGYKPRSTQEKLRVAETLEELPATAAALENGKLSWSAVRELTRVAVPETEHAWLDVAKGKTVHQLEALVAGKERGASPTSAPSPEARRHVLRFDVAAETFCVFREAIDKVRRDSGAALDDDGALMLIARHVLGGPRDEGRASYQIALTVCPSCSQGHQQGSGELVPVSADVVAMGECDGQHLGDLPTLTADGQHANSSFHGAPREEDTAGPTTRSAHVGAAAASGAGSGSGANASAPASTRAKQTIPPATRRAVLRRDHHRCRVPGCRHARFVDIHHIQLRAEGGQHCASNLVTLCSAHHRAAHRGELFMTGSAQEILRFRHMDGSDYGDPPDPRAADARAKAFAALCKLGFGEGETRRALAEVCRNVGAEPLGPERILREALSRLTSPNGAPANRH